MKGYKRRMYAPCYKSRISYNPKDLMSDITVTIVDFFTVVDICKWKKWKANPIFYDLCNGKIKPLWEKSSWSKIWFSYQRFSIIDFGTLYHFQTSFSRILIFLIIIALFHGNLKLFISRTAYTFLSTARIHKNSKNRIGYFEIKITFGNYCLFLNPSFILHFWIIFKRSFIQIHFFFKR